MMKDVYKVDEQGFYTDFVKVDEENNTYYTDSFEWDNVDFEYVEAAPPTLCRPKWNGAEWKEGATAEEIQTWQETNQPSEPEPTETEILQQAIAELSIVAAQNQQSIAELSILQMGGAADVQ